jgi:hypothetical protein
MSAETIKSDATRADEPVPQAADLQNSQAFLADWAREINEREQAEEELQVSSRKPGSNRRGMEKHFGRHREDSY